MILKNTTDYPDYFLRRMVAWCCKKSGLPVRRVTRAEFRNRFSDYSGHAYGSGLIMVSIGRYGFPTSPDDRPGMQGERFNDRTEALVAVTAHEVEHVCQYAERRIRQLHAERKAERATRVHEVAVLRLFREQRESLLSKWNEPPAPRVRQPKATRAERNEIAARKKLDEWQRKLKAAQNKVRTYRAKCRRYDRIAATRGQGATA